MAAAEAERKEREEEEVKGHWSEAVMSWWISSEITGSLFVQLVLVGGLDNHEK